jgi:hypothetical protein
MKKLQETSVLLIGIFSFLQGEKEVETTKKEGTF